MTNIFGISGSLRSGSFNTLLLQQAASAAPAGTRIELGSIKDIPLYDGDVESAGGLPAAAQKLKSRITECDGLLLATPEYNNGIPGVFNAAGDITDEAVLARLRTFMRGFAEFVATNRRPVPVHERSQAMSAGA